MAGRVRKLDLQLLSLYGKTYNCLSTDTSMLLGRYAANQPTNQTTLVLCDRTLLHGLLLASIGFGIGLGSPSRPVGVQGFRSRGWDLIWVISPSLSFKLSGGLAVLPGSAMTSLMPVYISFLL